MRSCDPLAREVVTTAAPALNPAQPVSGTSDSKPSRVQGAVQSLHTGCTTMAASPGANAAGRFRRSRGRRALRGWPLPSPPLSDRSVSNGRSQRAGQGDSSVTLNEDHFAPEINGLFRGRYVMPGRGAGAGGAGLASRLRPSGQRLIFLLPPVAATDSSSTA